ncbi:MAG: ComEC/Rec2 family competence protein [Chloroflexi bacterium]|nr:ComEC/Rec2 family competence protein [Chloroflexota bacterium]
MKQQEDVGIDLRGLTLIVVVGAWLTGMIVASFQPLPSLALLLAAGSGLILLVPLWENKQARFIIILAICVFLGAWRYTSAAPGGDPQAISTFISNNVFSVRGTVSDEPKLQGRSRVLVVAVSSISRNGGTSWQGAHGQLAVQTLGTSIEDPYGANYGDNVELRGKLQPPSPYNPAGTFASMAFPGIKVDSNEANPLIAWLYHLRVMLATVISQALPQPEAALLIAILLGLRTPALTLLTQAFNVTGTAHLIVPSGFKVTILAGLVASGTRWLYEGHQQSEGELLPAQKRGGWRRWSATALVIVSIAVYTILSGASPAALRSGVMGSLLVIAPRLGRIYNVYTALALTALLMSISDPFVLQDVGFQLSFLGTLGIILLTPFFQRLLLPVERLPYGHHIAEIIAVTLAAETATLPIFAVTFQEISFIAPIANMLTVPLLGTLIMLGVLICAAGIMFAPLVALCGWVAWPLLWYVTHIVVWCANVPGAYISVSNVDSSVAWGYYILLVGLMYFVARKQFSLFTKTQPHTRTPVLSPRLWRIAQLSAAALVILTTGAAVLVTRAGQLTISFLAVGPAGHPLQGEAILLRTADDKTVLIDGGLDIASLSQALDSRLPPWQRSLDAVLLTTPAKDHLTGLQDIVSRYQIGEVIDAGVLHPTVTYAAWRRTITERNLHYMAVVQGTTIPIGMAAALQVLWPTASLHKGSNETRDNGLIVRIVAPGVSVLLLGVAAQSKYALSGLLSNLDFNYLQAEIVQVVGEVNRPFPTELEGVLQKAHPSLLVITPALLSTQQSKLGISSTVIPPAPSLSDGSGWQSLQTAQVGTIEINSSNNGWKMNIM